MQENLVIVESPAKAKTIEKFLGKDYIVKSSFGHIRDLSKKDLGINIDDEFRPVYEIPGDKKKVVDELTKLAKSKTVWLASDEDREGEAIAWHLTEVLGLPVDQTKRIVFHEITKRAILEAIENPRTVNMDLVNAQQARRILDRLVGFELSPVLWKKVRPSLSAGRVQSVAVRLIVEREREIIAFRSAPYFRVVAQFYAANDPEKTLFKAELPSRFETQAEAEAFLRSCIGATFTVSKAEEKPAQRFPAPPFTTSTLQQEAGRKLGMSVSQTMSVAQHLYEQGLITYMRTDSVNLSQQALTQCKEEITRLYGEKYSSWHNYKTKTKGAQEAHEAIRPTSIRNTPEEVESFLSKDQWKLYRLIWQRFAASQMTPAVYDTMSIGIAAGERYELKASGSRLVFAGFTAVYAGADATKKEKDVVLPELAEGDELTLGKVLPQQHFTEPPPRYNDASLVKTLEEKEIGRPSTYAPIIETIQARGYVQRVDKHFQPTELGFLVLDMLEQYFKDIVDVKFTANLENELDEIAEGKCEKNELLREFYTPFEQTLEKADEAIGHVELPVEVSDVRCEKCGRLMVVKQGRFGKFLACPGFPECRNTKPLLVDTGVKCPKCGGSIVERKTRRGRKFYGCKNYPDCDYTTWDTPLKDTCPVCGSFMLRHQYKNGRALVYCSNDACSTRENSPINEELEKMRARLAAKRVKDEAKAAEGTAAAKGKAKKEKDS